MTTTVEEWVLTVTVYRGRLRLRLANPELIWVPSADLTFRASLRIWSLCPH
jgi:hypothetical protein